MSYTAISPQRLFVGSSAMPTFALWNVTVMSALTESSSQSPVSALHPEGMSQAIL